MDTTDKFKYEVSIPEIAETIIELEEDEFDGESIPVNYSISSYGADYPVDSLIKRIKRGVIFVPNFQRGYVWKPEHASRFIESLLLGLPVPGIFLAKETETDRLIVIDGQQRLWSLLYFYEGHFGNGKRFKLKGVDPSLQGLTYETLPENFKNHLDDCIIHATVIKQEEPSNDNTSIYHIFERLNTGGVRLQPQEIRACVYHGEFNDFLQELNSNSAWRSLFGEYNKHMKDQELILRFFALYYMLDEYKNPMKEFLNTYMSRNADFNMQTKEDLRFLFENTIDTIMKCIGQKAFKPNNALRTAVFDAVMVGLATRLSKGEIFKPESVLFQYQELLENEEFKEHTQTYTTQEQAVRKRIELAKYFFEEVK